MNRHQWERLARRVKKSNPLLFVDTQDWYVRRTGRRVAGYGLSCIDTRTGEHFVLWSPRDWEDRRKGEGYL